MSGSGRIIIIGRTGQLARALAGLVPSAKTLARSDLDLSWPAGRLAEAFEHHLTGDVSGVILAAAYTQVDLAEDDLDLAMTVNGVSPGTVAKVCKTRNIPLIHVSTDYVFNGAGTSPYTVDHPADPINVYGMTKRMGEKAVMNAGGTFAILRTSWVYDADGKNFLTTMLRLSETRKELSIVDDQIGRPTYALDLAQAALSALKGLQSGSNKSGVYHVSNTGPAISWADFAAAIFEGAQINMVVKPIPSADYPTPAKRPAFSVMDVSLFENTFRVTLPSWTDGLSRALAQRDLAKRSLG